MLPPEFQVPMGSLKKFSKFGSAVWPAIANIYIQIYKYIYERRALLYKWFYGKCTYHPAICSWRQANKKYIGLGFQKIIINKTLSHKAHKRFLWAGYAQFTRVPLKALSDQVLIKLLTILKFNFFNCGFTLQIGLTGKH